MINFLLQCFTIMERTTWSCALIHSFSFGFAEGMGYSPVWTGLCEHDVVAINCLLLCRSHGLVSFHLYYTVSFIEFVLLAQYFDNLASRICTTLGFQWEQPIGEQFLAMVSCVLCCQFGFQWQHSINHGVACCARVCLCGGAGRVQCKFLNLVFSGLPH